MNNLKIIISGMLQNPETGAVHAVEDVKEGNGALVVVVKSAGNEYRANGGVLGMISPQQLGGILTVIEEAVGSEFFHRSLLYFLQNIKARDAGTAKGKKD